MIREIDPLARLRVAPGKIEDQPVADFTQRETHLPAFISLDGAGFFPNAVGDFRDAFSEDVFRAMDHLASNGIDQLGAILAQHFLDSRFSHVVGGDFALEVETDHRRLPRHIDNGVTKISPEHAAIDALDSRYSDSFVEDLCGAG